MMLLLEWIKNYSEKILVKYNIYHINNHLIRNTCNF